MALPKIERSFLCVYFLSKEKGVFLNCQRGRRGEEENTHTKATYTFWYKLLNVVVSTKKQLQLDF